jgi:hypothetical protein
VAAALLAAAIVCVGDRVSAAPDAEATESDVASIDSFLISRYFGENPSHGDALLSSPDRALADRFLYFGGIDLWRNGGFVHGGTLWSPDGLDRSGFSLKLLLGAGRYQYRAGMKEITGDQMLASVMPGWRFKAGDLEVVVLGGLDLQNHELQPDDPTNRLRGTHVGFRGNIDLWYQPTENTMASLSLSGSTLGTNIWTRAALGWRMSGMWVGPESVVYSDEHYRQYRFGAHVTSLHAGQVELSFGIGYVQDTDHRSGAYGRIGLLTRQ